jgi:outer membrane protein assembly factor BamB
MLSLLFAFIVPSQPAGGIENAASLLLAQAKLQAQAGQYDVSLTTLQKILDTAGDDLVETSIAGYRVHARQAVNDFLLTWPDEGLKLYRTRYDGLAKKRLEAALKQTENRELISLVETFPIATASESALLELARRAFLKGDFPTALRYWRGVERFPKAQTPIPLTKARIILALHFSGDRESAQKAFTEFEKNYPEAQGNLFDRTGLYTKILKEWLENPVTSLAPSLENWETLGGDSTRNGLANRLPVFFPEKPFFSAPLPTQGTGQLGSSSMNPDHPRGLALHPILVGSTAYFTDGASVWRYEIRSSKIQLLGTFGRTLGVNMPNRGETMQSLTHSRGLLFFRAGAREWKSNEKPLSELVCLTTEGKKCWSIAPPTIADSVTVWEGPPTVVGSRWYASYLKIQGVDVRCGVVCYSGFSDSHPGELLWNIEVGKAETPLTQTTTRGAVLTVADGRIYLCTHAGQIVALHAETGKILWQYLYSSNDKRQSRYHDLLPCLIHGETVYAAPFDTNVLFAFDRLTGQPLWSRSGIEVVHLLGVTKRKLIVTVAGPVKGIRGLDIQTGSDSGARGWTQHDDSGEATFGRGFVTEEAIAWPTAHGLQLLDPDEGRPLRQPIADLKGNLVYSQGVLISLTTLDLRCYLSEKRRLQIRKPDGEIPKESRLKMALDDRQFEELQPLCEGLSPDWHLRVCQTLEGFQQPELAQRFRQKIPKEWNTVVLGPARVPISRVPTTDPVKPFPPLPPPRLGDDLTRVNRKNFSSSSGAIVPITGTSLLYQRGEQIFFEDAPISIKHRVRQALTLADSVILMGEGGITLLERSSGKIVWEFLAPIDTNQRFYMLENRDTPEPFQNFQVLGGTILFRVGEAVWQCLDLATGRTRWIHFAKSERQLLGPAGPKFSQFLGVSETHVLLQNSLGEVRCVDRASGSIRWIYGGPPILWSAPPLWLKGRWLLPDATERVIFLSDAEGKLVGEWTSSYSEDTTGKLPTCWLCPQGILVLVERNCGIELELLHEKTLKPMWKKSLLLPKIEARQIVHVTAKHLLIQDAADLLCYRIEDGVGEWKTPLPNRESWSLLAQSESSYLLCPCRTVPVLRGTRGSGLISLGLALYHGYEQAEFPVLKLDASTGQYQHCFRLAAIGPQVSVSRNEKGWDVVTGAGIWRIQNSDP